MQGVDFGNSDKCKAWLCLSSFDYMAHDDILIPEGEQMDCRCLLKINDKFSFHRGFIYGFCPEK